MRPKLIFLTALLGLLFAQMSYSAESDIKREPQDAEDLLWIFDYPIDKLGAQ